MEYIGKFFSYLIIIAIVVLCIGGLIYWLWGAIAVSVFGLPTLTYWQTIGLW